MCIFSAGDGGVIMQNTFYHQRTILITGGCLSVAEQPKAVWKIVLVTRRCCYLLPSTVNNAAQVLLFMNDGAGNAATLTETNT